MLPSRTRNMIWAVSIGVWLIVGFLYGSQVFIDMLEMHHSYWKLALWGTAFGLLWGVFTPPIIEITRRYPFEKPQLGKSALVHVAAFMVFHLGSALWVTTLNVLIHPFDPMSSTAPFINQFVERFRFSSVGAVFLYALLVCVGHIVEYGRRARQREMQATELQTMLAQAEVASLKSQLQPHFLFNTLNGIVSLVRCGENESAEKMIVGLSQLLRHSLDDMGKTEVTLKEELDFLGLYLGIEQMRFSDRLRVSVKVSPQAQTAQIPTLLLQPLVENAIRHAAATRLAPTSVCVGGDVMDGRLRLSVTDDGPGLPSGFSLEEASGIGLHNVQKRLQALYGDNQTMSIETRPEGGVAVRIEMPFLQADEV
ncbi:MAG: histidine kinase [Armatimonadetes bacterium]|nr:histidine kinase [Armatimonadota bacterium]